MLRVVVAVALGVALVGTTMPAVETAGRERTATHVVGEADRLTAAIRDLRARERAAVGPGARRVVAVRLPPSDWTHAGVDYLAVGGRPDGPTDGAALTWRVSGAAPDGRHVDGVRLETAGDGPLVLREPGVHRVTLALRRCGRDRCVRVSRLG